jgi:hypothetical protein
MAGANPTAEKVTDGLVSMHNFRISGYPIDFSAVNRRGSNFIDIAVIGAHGKLAY